MSDYYILDSSVILQNPEVLAFTPVEKIVIPELVVEDLKRAGPNIRRGIVALAKVAIGKGAISASTPDTPLISKVTARLHGNLSITDASIADIALDYSNIQRKKVSVVTEDEKLINFLNDLGVNSLSASEFISISSKSVADDELVASIRQVHRTRLQFAVGSFIAGLLVATLGNQFVLYLDKIVSTISIWGTLIVLIFVGIGLYFYRERARLAYGISEIIVGIYSAYYVLPADLDYNKLAQSELFQIIAGLYVIVRGLDNIGKALEGTPSEKKWKRIFAGK